MTMRRPRRPAGIRPTATGKRGRSVGYSPIYSPDQTQRYKSQALRYSKAVEIASGGPDHAQVKDDILIGDQLEAIRNQGENFSQEERYLFRYTAARSGPLDDYEGSIPGYWTVRYEPPPEEEEEPGPDPEDPPPDPGEGGAAEYLESVTVINVETQINATFTQNFNSFEIRGTNPDARLTFYVEFVVTQNVSNFAITLRNNNAAAFNAGTIYPLIPREFSAAYTSDLVGSFTQITGYAARGAQGWRGDVSGFPGIRETAITNPDLVTTTTNTIEFPATAGGDITPGTYLIYFSLDALLTGSGVLTSIDLLIGVDGDVPPEPDPEPEPEPEPSPDGWLCDCPDFQKRSGMNEYSPYLAEQSPRDWQLSAAGADEDCKHIIATKLFLGLNVPVPTDYPI